MRLTTAPLQLTFQLYLRRKGPYRYNNDQLKIQYGNTFITTEKQMQASVPMRPEISLTSEIKAESAKSKMRLLKFKTQFWSIQPKASDTSRKHTKLL